MPTRFFYFSLVALLMFYLRFHGRACALDAAGGNSRVVGGSLRRFNSFVNFLVLSHETPIIKSSFFSFGSSRVRLRLRYWIVDKSEAGRLVD